METTPNTNIPPFYPGQKVVYITGIVMSKNSVHIITEIKLDKCGCWTVGINNNPIVVSEKDYPRSQCTNCKKILVADVHKKGTAFCATSFRPVQEAKMIRVSFEKIVEEIPVIAN